MSRTLNIAHRGARSLAPENTIAAARKGLEARADMWELDVQLTKDEELIVIHDDDLTRTSDAPIRFRDRYRWLLSDFTLAEIQTLDCGSWFNQKDPFGQIKAGAVSAEDQQSYVGEPAPSLREALEFTRDRDWRVNVEIKDQPTRPMGENIVRQTVALIEALDMGERVIVSSFNHDYLRQVRALNLRLAAGVLSSSAIPDPVEYLAGLGAQAYNPHYTTLQPAEVRRLQEQGVLVNLWTVNDEATMRALVEAGAGGIITDFPQVLARILRESEQ